MSHKTIGLFCRISSLLQGSFAKETYNTVTPRTFFWVSTPAPHLSQTLTTRIPRVSECECLTCQSADTLLRYYTHTHTVTLPHYTPTLMSRHTDTVRHSPIHTYTYAVANSYGVSTISRLLKIICLFCRI